MCPKLTCRESTTNSYQFLEVLSHHYNDRTDASKMGCFWSKIQLMCNRLFKSAFRRVEYNSIKLFCTINNDYFKPQEKMSTSDIRALFVLFYNNESVFFETRRICICFKYFYDMTDVRYRNRFKTYKKDRTFQRSSNTRLLYSRIVLIGMCILRFTVSRKTWRNGNKNAQWFMRFAQTFLFYFLFF